MKNMLILLVVVGIYSCGSKSPGNTGEATGDSVVLKADTLNSSWINDFRDFRNAVYHNDVNKIKTHFSFPVLNTNNEIWSVALADSTDFFAGVGSDTIIPFTEKDFAKYYKKLFRREFINGILKIKSDELFKKNRASTDLLDSDSTTSYIMHASIDKEDNTLSLVLSFNTSIEDDNGDFVEGGEAGIGYIFIIQPDGHLLFKEIRIAG
jgi:hypothetical protein